MDQKIIDLYDTYTHGGMSRRTFFDKLVMLTGGIAAATALLPILENNYAKADMVPETDSRIKTELVTFKAGAQDVKGYLVRPAADGKYPSVVVVHENRGLNPHTKDVARRLAVAGYLSIAVDFLSPIGGTPSDQDKARDMIGTLNASDVTNWAQGAVAYLRGNASSNGKVGAVGFCWGGGVIGRLAVAEPSLDAAVVYYGQQPPAEEVAKIQAPLLLNYAGLDERINAGIPAFEDALKKSGKEYTLHIYEGAQHAFLNDTNEARYSKEAADLAWSRTLDFFKQHLAG
ncbi:dienelactone hydrolase family protein [Dongia deserti]|uniref:dienelactone hydrolase family protein n=1 Tax=Dongia deserti TaxID=2268030 RepID=UPI002548F553|nr:dienelactone hydrolase family protein [Dongia deserti]